MKRAMLKRTPLFSAHQRLGARLVEFGGWEMPVQYAGILEEHLAVRQAAGIFDISHMGEVSVQGPAALSFLNRLLTNDLSRLAVGQGQYTLLCNEQGGTIDDLYVYRIDESSYLMVINASRIEADTSWLKSQLDLFPEAARVELRNVSDQMGALAIQGPRVATFIDRAFRGPSVGGTIVAVPTLLKKNQVAAFSFGGALVWVARTGYTGEDGFEIVSPASLIEGLWTILLTDGQAAGLVPCGLGARDTLRTEMGYPLYGHELDEQTTPIEAGLGAFVALEKGEFLGRVVLARQKADGVQRKCVGFRMLERGAPPRPGYPIWSTGAEPSCLGRVASGTLSPTLGVGIGMGYVPVGFAKVGTALEIEIRGRRTPATVVAKPLHKKAV
jgi:aminomethyltransferase